MTGIYAEKTVRARKPHQCDGCLTAIHPSESYLRINTQSDDGTPCSIAYHQDCRDWEVYLCQKADLMPDEWTALHEYVDEGGLEVLKGAPQPVRDRFARKIRNERRADQAALSAAHD